MADELQIINQPDSVPGPVSTGYTQQNVIAEAMRNGFDGTAPKSNTSTTVQIPIGGPVDVNGVLFSLASASTLTIPLANTDYYIYLAAGSTVDFLTPTLTTSAGTFDASKNARYTGSGERILNWVVRRDASASYVYKMLDVQNVLILTNQGLRTTNNVTFGDITGGAISGTSINTGLGVTEVYPMDQSVASTASVDFARADFSGSGGVAINVPFISGSICQFDAGARIGLPTEGSISVAAGGSSTLSTSAIWVLGGLTSTLLGQINVSGTWRNIAGGDVVSNGADARVSNTGGTAATFYYKRTV
jgi:hypothetical protein